MRRAVLEKGELLKLRMILDVGVSCVGLAHISRYCELVIIA